MAPHGKELSEDLKKIIVALNNDGVGYKKIAKTLKLSSIMVAKTTQRFNRTGSTQNRPHHGRSKKLSACAQHHIQRLFLGNRRMNSARCWKHCSEVLVLIDMIASCSCCRFVGCTSMMRIFYSTTSQKCSIGLRSDDCGGHLSKVNSLSCSRNQSEMIWALWHGALSCWK